MGFFDLAIAAPSMKAALEAWGADSNLFHQGMAKQSDDPDVIAATTAAPGVVLRRPVGSNGPFKEHAALPTNIEGTHGAKRAGRQPAKQTKKRLLDPAAERKAALAYEKEEQRRERERQREEAARERERERRRKAIEKAQSALDAAAQEHERAADDIRAQIEALEQRVQAEDARWQKERARLETALRRARE